MRRGLRLLFLRLFVQPSLFIPLPGTPPPQLNSSQTPVIQQNPGQPLPPGTVTYQNTWNQTQSQQCAYPHLPREPLLSRASNWTIVVSIPTLLLMGEPSSSFIKHAYTFYANGTFLATDDRGNSFAVRGLGGLPGTAATTLRGNSTVALQNYLWVLGRQTIANVTVSYTVRRQFCQPAGLEIAITGQMDWMIGKARSLSLKFNKPPVKLEPLRAWFGGNDSRVQLGFDWGDSLQYAPSFDRTLNALSWSVGPTFRIDPQTVSSTSVSTMQQQSRNLWFANGRWWLFYEVSCGGTYYFACIEVTSSIDGVTWTAPTQLDSNCCYQPMLSVWVNTRNGHYYYVVDQVNEMTAFVWGHGTLNSDGTITETLTDAPVGFPGVCGPYITNVISNSVVLDSYQNLFASFETTTGTCPRGYQPGSNTPSFIAVMKWTNSTNRWSASLYTYAGSYDNMQAGELVPLTHGKLALVNCDTGGACAVSNYNGTFWSYPTRVTTSAQCNWWGGCSFSAVSAGDTTYAALVTSSGASFFSYPYGGPASQVSTVKSTGSDSIQVGLTTDSSGRLFTTVADSTRNTIFTNRSADGGNTWTSANAIAGETSIQNPSLAAVYSTSSLLGLTWVAGSSSPYNIRFAAIPAVIPDAASSTNSWSKAGIAPYSAYFAHLSEYMSPGNGLLTVRQDDLYLPGRGIDLDIARVFSTPYAFRSGSPYQYDNFTLSNLGYGWSLDFPWLGANYLHLSGGQAYPYQWSGDVFEYHEGNDFKLVHNADGTFTLYPRGGTQYQYNGAKQLTAIIDHTGNNTLSFAYGSNGYISQVTDAIGRNAGFTHDTSNPLSSIGSSSRTWSYSYSGNDLVSVADPLGRVTTFQYNTGINSWLISAVLYPTGGRSMYAYGSAAVGTENVRTYYVTSRNVYYSPASLSQTSSTSYSILDGNVVWSNTTVSDGVSPRGYESYNFQTSRNLMKQYDRDSTGAVVRIAESDYDASGRINRTRIFSPSGALLAYSLMYYDNWGDLKHSRDFVGHHAWFSSANTDSANQFNMNGFTNSFYTKSLSPNVHDALVGRAEFQNGFTIAYDPNFGNAASGPLIVSVNTQLTSNRNFTSLTVSAGVTLDTCGNVIRVNGTLTNYGTITDTCSGGAPGRLGVTKNGFTGGWGGGNGGSGGPWYGASGGQGGKGGGIVIIFAVKVFNYGSISADGQNGWGGGGCCPGTGGGGGGGGGQGGQVYLYYH